MKRYVEPDQHPDENAFEYLKRCELARDEWWQGTQAEMASLDRQLVGLAILAVLVWVFALCLGAFR